MALTILQYPASASLAQSPIAFSVSSSTNVTESNFQYVGELYYWTGSVASSGSVKYTLTKFPNNTGVGIFDVSRILNSTLADYAIANTSNIEFFKIKFSTQWLSGSVYVTGSDNITTDIYKTLDGYSVFQEPIGQQLHHKAPAFPILSAGPLTQSFFTENQGTLGVYTAEDGGLVWADEIFYSGSNGATGSVAIVTGSATSEQIQQIPAFPYSLGFPLNSYNLTQYTLTPRVTGSATAQPITFNYECIQKYPNVRIRWKNRFGQFDWLNCYGVHQTSFSTDRSNYQPQLGSWESSTLTYNNYDTQLKTYVVNAKESLTVNTQYIAQDYNDIFKQFLSSDEMYWVYDEASNLVRPITINVNSLTFKTGVNDKLIQYTFTFDYGQGYKLII